MPVYEPNHCPYLNYLCCTPDIAAVGNILDVFSYHAVLGEILTYHLRKDEQTALHGATVKGRYYPLRYIFFNFETF